MHASLHSQVGETRRTIAAALASAQEESSLGNHATELAIDRHLDAVFSARVGIHFLTEHYLAARTQRKGFAGIIQPDCSPVEVCRALAQEKAEEMRRTYGAAPSILVHGSSSQTFNYVPSHIQFVVGELLSNAGKATVRHHLQTSGGRLTTLPPIRVVVAVGDGAVTVKVADEAGGIPRSSLGSVWSYQSLASSHWRKGVGMGLPLARLYATYFGGSLHLVPVEGYGMDGYVQFNKLANENSEVILEVPSPTKPSAEELTIPEAQQREGKWRTALRLFDAQSRRASVDSQTL